MPVAARAGPEQSWEPRVHQVTLVVPGPRCLSHHLLLPGCILAETELEEEYLELKAGALI